MIEIDGDLRDNAQREAAGFHEIEITTSLRERDFVEGFLVSGAEDTDAGGGYADFAIVMVGGFAASR